MTFSELWNKLVETIKNWAYSFIGINIFVEAHEQGVAPSPQAYVQLVFSLVTALIAILMLHRTLYTIIGIFGRSRKYPSAPKDKHYAFIISAWNEEAVIANTIESIRAMDYPQDLIDIFVVADNCTDRTAEIAESFGKGVHVYRHDDPNERMKGFAFRYMFEQMKKEYDIEHDFFAYSVIDADNVPAPDFLTKINDFFAATGYDEVVGYRNIKNTSENWIAAMCGVQSFSQVVTALRPRSMLKCNQQIYGPSSTFRSYLLKDGWYWTSLTEDIDMEIDLTAKGYRTGYCEEAIIYEEQPTSLKTLWRQRLRWAKGNLIAFKTRHWELTKSFLKKPSWNKYDMYWQFFPSAFFSFWWSLLYQAISISLFLAMGEGYNWMNFLTFILTYVLGIYFSNFLMYVITIIKEWKHFLLPIHKTIVYLFLLPIYNLIDPIMNAICLFTKTKWRKIDHHFVKGGAELAEEEAKKQNKRKSKD